MRKQIIQVLLEIRALLRNQFSQYNEYLPFILTILITLILFTGAIILFVDLTASLHSEALDSYDQKVTDFVVSHRSPGLTKFLEFITHIGDVYGYLVISIITSIIFYLTFKNWRYVIEIFFVLIISGISNVVLKQIINRERPDVEHLVSVATLSYPSGHAMSAIAFYGFMIFLIYNFKLKWWIKIALILTFSFIILAIGISRIYLGVHYPSDIAGGFIAGFIWVVFCIILFHTIDLWRKRVAKKKMNTTKN